MKRDSELSVVWHGLEHLHEEVNQICNDMTKSATDAIQCDMIITVGTVGQILLTCNMVC